MKRFLLLTSTLAALLALSAPAAQAGRGDGITLNGPALDGRQVALPAGLRIGVPDREEAQAIAANGPALDGREVALPAGLRIGAPAREEAQAIASNGPALDGRQVALPAGLSIHGASQAQFFEGGNCPVWECGSNGPALGGWQVALPELAALAINPLRLPGDSRGVLPSDQRWPAAEQDQRAQR